MTSLIIAEDQNMLRQAMVQLIKLHGDFEILADTDNGLDAMKLIEEIQPKRRYFRYRNARHDWT